MALKIKKAYQHVVIGFNNSSKPIGSRNDTHILYELAKFRKRKDWLDMFEEVTEKEVEKAKEDKFNEKQSQKNNA